MKYPEIRKAKRVAGRTLCFRNAEIADANFILMLRTDINKSQHLTNTSKLLSEQESWMEQYARRDHEAYFVIETQNGESVGTVRLYDGMENSFCWGSWIVKAGAPNSVAIESALMVYSYALNELGFLTAHFKVNKENFSVCKFHERFGAIRVREDDLELFFEISNQAILSSIKRYKRYLPSSIVVEKFIDTVS